MKFRIPAYKKSMLKPKPRGLRKLKGIVGKLKAVSNARRFGSMTLATVARKNLVSSQNLKALKLRLEDQGWQQAGSNNRRSLELPTNGSPLKARRTLIRNSMPVRGSRSEERHQTTRCPLKSVMAGQFSRRRRSQMRMSMLVSGRCSLERLDTMLKKNSSTKSRRKLIDCTRLSKAVQPLGQTQLKLQLGNLDVDESVDFRSVLEQEVEPKKAGASSIQSLLQKWSIGGKPSSELTESTQDSGAGKEAETNTTPSQMVKTTSSFMQRKILKAMRVPLKLKIPRKLAGKIRLPKRRKAFKNLDVCAYIRIEEPQRKSLPHQQLDQVARVPRRRQSMRIAQLN